MTIDHAAGWGLYSGSGTSSWGNAYIEVSQSSLWRGAQPATTAPKDASVPPDATVITMQAPIPPSLPQFAETEAFSFLNTGYAQEATPEQYPAHLLGGATGGTAPSRLAQDQGTAIEQFDSVEKMLLQRRDDPFTKDVPAIDCHTRDTTDPLNTDFIANFGMIQTAMEANRLKAKGRSDKGIS